jgi:hypothetical protein
VRRGAGAEVVAMLKVKIIEAGLQDLPRGTTLGEYVEVSVNEFLAKKAGVEIVRMHMNTVVIPPEEGGGQFREMPASVVVLIALYYNE